MCKFRAVIFRVLPVVFLASGLAFGTASVVQAAVKFNPGHYRLTRAGETNNARLSLQHPGIEGVSVSIKWNAFEPSKGQYKFNLIDQWLALAKQYGKHLVVRILERTFDSRPSPLPGFVLADGCQVSRLSHKTTASTGLQFALWDGKCMDHFIDVLTAIGRKYNGESAFEAILGEENSHNVGNIPGNTPQARATQYMRLHQAIGQAMPNTLYLQGMNFDNLRGAGGLNGLATSVGNTGSGGISSPDLCTGLEIPVYDIYRKNKGKLPIAPQAQRTGCRGAHGSEEERAFFAINDLGATHIFWTLQDNLDRATTQQTKTGCPSALSGCN